ncbi:MAG: leucyl aminopeptidase [SAR324 cluster bacterium]|uniref:Probable cytosol aminopeptidase n=1 Tax=SAR324 cluster bacterium TaxID=2024889 RepID=A0A7X9FQQ7_9DELT|nr:leucyl aminopeptidase [SAR324 cluster bacterium]
MKIKGLVKKLRQIKTDLVVVPISSEISAKKERFAPHNTAIFSSLNPKSRKMLSEIFLRKQLSFERKKNIFVDTPGFNQFKGILLIEVPSIEEAQERKGIKLQRVGRKIYDTAKENGFTSVTIDTSLNVLQQNEAYEALLEGIYLNSYDYSLYKANSKEKHPFLGIKELTFLGLKTFPTGLASKSQKVNEGLSLARNLGNMPASDCTPSYFLECARIVAQSEGLKLKVLGEKELQKMGAYGILSVSKGSSEKPFLISLRYCPKKKTSEKVIGLVGKGITFDTGGICLKPSIGMEEMKHDMAGAAAVLASVKILAALKAGIEVRAYIPVTENAIDGRSTKPGDVIKTLKGKTVEVINTDAEGRLILADALTLAEHEGCDEIIDLATLTGAAVVALGTDCAALYSSDSGLAQNLLKAASASREYLWELPLIEEYKDQLKSKIADLKNLGDKSRGGGSISGALFLQEFIEKAKWAHIDIAGPALRTTCGEDGEAGASGYGVRTIVNYVLTHKA